ncbi:MAG: PQQ-like beta-propeller repeat protein [Chloroflexi bacterium]|nr:PQQ-like beta-propeller repeat protein [Chloroflexota bacterium]
MTGNRQVIEMPPPAPVRRHVDALRRAEPPTDLLDSVMAEVERTRQVGQLRMMPIVVGGSLAAVAAAAIGIAVLFSSPDRVGGPDATRTPLPSPASQPAPIRDLPAAGSVEATAPIGPGQILTTSAFDAPWFADPAAGTIQRLDPGSMTFDAPIEIRPRGGPPRLWLASDGELLWAGTGVPGRTLVAVDPELGDVVREVDLGLAPFWVAAGNGMVWVTDRERDLLVGIDASTGAELHRVSIAEPTGVHVGETIWVASAGDDEVMEVDPRSGRVLRAIGVPADPVQVVRSAEALYVMGGDARIVAIDLASGVTREGPRTLVALAVLAGEPWALSAVFDVGLLDPASLDFSAALKIGPGGGEGLVAAAGSLWTIDRDTLYRIRPAPP